MRSNVQEVPMVTRKEKAKKLKRKRKIITKKKRFLNKSN